jgi:hypothetical protein
MRGIRVRKLAAVALLAMGLVGLQARAEEPFDLVFDLKLTTEMTSLLKSGDTLQFVLQPQVQFGQRTAPGAPISVEKVWSDGMTLAPITFKNAVGPDQIYRLELRVSRRGADGSVRETRYLSALDKTQRRPVNQAIPLRLQIADPDDARDNNVFLVRDSDGIYRVMMFFA